MTLEDPQDKVYEDFINNIYPKQGLGLPIIGSVESISEVKRDELFNFYQKSFISDDLIIVISGRVNIDEIVDFIGKFNFRRGEKQKNIKADQGNESFFFTELPSEQLHIVSGNSKFSLNEETYIHGGLLNLILGETMSSRFFQKLREDLGLCYSVHSFINKYRDESLFGIYMSIMPKNAKKAIDETSKVIEDLIKNGITKDEFKNSKKQKIGEIILNTDILQKRMQRIAGLEIKFGQYFDENYIIDKIEKTKIDDLNSLIKNIFVSQNFLTQGLYKKKVEIEKWKF